MEYALDKLDGAELGGRRWLRPDDQQRHEDVLRIKLYEEGRGGRSRSRSRSRSPRRRRVSRSRFERNHPSKNAIKPFS